MEGKATGIRMAIDEIADFDDFCLYFYNKASASLTKTQFQIRGTSNALRSNR